MGGGGGGGGGGHAEGHSAPLILRPGGSVLPFILSAKVHLWTINPSIYQ